MSNEYVLTTDDNGDLAVRTVVAEESSTANSTDVITATTDGKLAIRVVGSGGSGGDSHNKGYFATQAALEEAYPTGEAGDYAIVGATDTVWIWDDDNSEWVDTDTKGEVTSVNGQTGAVVLNADDVGAVPTTPYEYTAELEFTPNVDTEGAIIIELAGDNIATLQIGQYVSYEDGGVWDDPVEDAVYTAFMQPSLDTSVGASKILWTTPVNRLIYMDGYAGTGQNEESILTLKYQYNDSGLAEDHCKIVLKILSDKALTITATKDPSEFVTDTGAGIMSLPIPLYDESDQTQFYPVQQGGLINWQPIPQVESLPSQTGHSGEFLTTNGTDASWSDRPVIKGSNRLNYGDMPILWAAGYGDSLNVLQLGAGSGSSPTYGVTLGAGQNNVLDIKGWGTTYADGLLGTIKVNNVFAKGTTPCLGTSAAHWDTLYVDKINNGNAITVPTTGGTMVVVDYTGATSGQVLTYNGTNAVWSAPGGGGGSTSATALLDEMGWSGNSQTVNVTGVTASNNVIVAAAPASQSDYSACGIICTAQGAGTLTFTCDSVPTTGITVNVLII